MKLKNCEIFFSNETLNVFFWKFLTSEILDFPKTVSALQILSHRSSWNSRVKELWALENHVLANMLLCSSRLRCIKCTLGHSSKYLVSLFHVHPIYTLFSRFLKVVIGNIYVSNDMNKVYNGIFVPKFSVSMIKEIIALIWDYVYKTRK